MARSGPASVAGTRLRRVVLRLVALAGFTALGWLTAVLLASTASADTGSQHGDTTTPHSPAAKNSGRNSGNQGLLGGLLNGVVGTVGNTVGNVTNVVSNTVGTVTNTVTNTLGTVGNVVSSVADLPNHVLPDSQGKKGGGISLPSLITDNPVTDLLSPVLPKSSGKTTTAAAEQVTARVDQPAAAPVVAAPAPVVEVTPLAEPAHFRNVTHTVVRTDDRQVDVQQARGAVEHAAPGGDGPSPLPSPSSPLAPATPCPSFSSGNHGGSGARGVLSTLAPQSLIAPPPLVGRPNRAYPAAERGHTPGLPVTTPD